MSRQQETLKPFYRENVETRKGNLAQMYVDILERVQKTMNQFNQYP